VKSRCEFGAYRSEVVKQLCRPTSSVNQRFCNFACSAVPNHCRDQISRARNEKSRLSQTHSSLYLLLEICIVMTFVDTTFLHSFPEIVSRNAEFMKLQHNCIRFMTKSQVQKSIVQCFVCIRRKQVQSKPATFAPVITRLS